jgi:hypothetical protein
VWHRGTPVVVTLAVLVTAAPALADNLGAIGRAFGALIVLAVALLVLVVGSVAAVAGRRRAPRRTWKLVFGGLGLLATGAALVLNLTADAALGGAHPLDVVLIGVVPTALSVLALLACARLLWVELRPRLARRAAGPAGPAGPA